MEYELYEIEFIDELKNSITFLETQLSRVSVAGANPQLFNNLKISYYDELITIGELTTITIPEPQQLLIKPFDKETVKDIYKMIEKQNYSISLMDEGHQIRVAFPILTTDKRKESVKQLATIKESTKQKVRAARQSVLKMMKVDENLSEDVLKDFQNKIQKLVEKYNGIIDMKVFEKEEQLMKL